MIQPNSYILQYIGTLLRKLDAEKIFFIWEINL